MEFHGCRILHVFNIFIIFFSISNGRYTDYLSLPYATNKNRILKVPLKILHSTKEKKTLKIFKINIGFLIIRSSHRNRREEVSSPSFLSWPPSVAHTLSH